VQLSLFDPVDLVSGPIASDPACRNEIGRWGEVLAARALGLDLTPITNQVICPDFRRGDLRGEIKTVGDSGQGLIYKWRLEKEAWHYDPSSYLYVFVRHRVKIKLRSREAVLLAFRQTPPTILACTLADVVDAIGDKPPKKFSIHEKNAEHGCNRPGYREGGWQFRTSKIAVDDEAKLSIAWPQVALFDAAPLSVTLKTTARWRAIIS
jgi:hypothetical protein